MKKFFICLMVVVLLFATISCSKGNTENTIDIQYGVKYIVSSDKNLPQEEQEYFIFNNNGTGVYHYYYSYDSSIDPSYSSTDSYTIEFIYDYVSSEDTAFCFFNSVTYEEGYSGEDFVNTTWSRTLMVSKNVIMLATNGGLFIAENYLQNELPNYAKSSQS